MEIFRSSIPIKNTTGNSSPFALCNVINVTASSVSSSSSTSLVSVILSKNSAKLFSTASSSNYLDQGRFNELKRLGNQALAEDNIDQLRTVLFELLSIQIHSDSGDGMFDIANIVKG